MADAAAVLGVSMRQVERLTQAGDVTETGRVGRALLLDAASVHRCAQSRRRRGRPWDAGTAWSALSILSGLPVDRLPATHRTRLVNRLRRSTADEVAYLARRRQVAVHRMRGWGGELAGAGSVLVASGVSALGADPAMAARFGLTSSGPDSVEGYVLERHLETLTATFGLVPDPVGEITLRAASAAFPALGAGTVPVAAVAVDLMDSLNTRERSAGNRVLQELLDDLR